MSCKDVDKEIMEIFDTIFRVDPMFFSRVDKGAIELQREQMRENKGYFEGVNQMEITVVDIWLSKIKNYGWKIEDIPKKYRKLRKELKRRLKENGSQGRKSAPGIDS